jgi:hypothetical protein
VLEKPLVVAAGASRGERYSPEWCRCQSQACQPVQVRLESTSGCRAESPNRAQSRAGGPPGPRSPERSGQHALSLSRRCRRGRAGRTRCRPGPRDRPPSDRQGRRAQPSGPNCCRARPRSPRSARRPRPPPARDHDGCAGSCQSRRNGRARTTGCQESELFAGEKHDLRNPLSQELF